MLLPQFNGHIKDQRSVVKWKSFGVTRRGDAIFTDLFSKGNELKDIQTHRYSDKYHDDVFNTYKGYLVKLDLKQAGEQEIYVRLVSDKQYGLGLSVITATASETIVNYYTMWRITIRSEDFVTTKKIIKL